ncbi:RNA methyltransferase [Rossellomorea aquimaris]|uniref:RNA methyltransferase n=1 Tax=Rossellomorea aquimaris TaxID=189382 RepID=A0A5D4UIB3_9BACI|nr:RNA methyltransferase [Rossellomorea aquimaris]TYS77869.1 RNA methyltransferase [Rossellomorea aquimaris]TYS87052.1 RNA methyltransferase [Rossellomorea aquimaris]
MKYIQSSKNPVVKQWKKLLTKKERDLTRTYIIEGFHLVEEALKQEDTVLELIQVEGIDLPQKWTVDSVSMTMVSDEVGKVLSDTETSQGIFAICKQKEDEHDREKAETFMLLDGLQDPGNIGTIIRTAEAAGIDMVVLGKGTVDPYNPKVLRSAQGAHFHIPIIRRDLTETIPELKERNIPVYGTALENGVEYTTIKPQSSYALIVGNEGNGMSKELLTETDQNLYIPIYGKSESLNVAIAAGVLLYYFKNGQ